jgi:ABC-type transporter Mla subunit MlaD
MNPIQQLEMLSESIKNEIDELQSLLQHSDNTLLKAKRDSVQRQLGNIISNLESTNDAIYGVFEELNCNNDIEELERDYDVLYETLQDKLSYEEKVDMRIKYGIDFPY